MNKTTFDDDMQPLERAIEIVGSQAKLAKEIGVAQQTISSWLHRVGRVPAEYCYPIQKATRGEVLEGDLRPDLF